MLDESNSHQSIDSDKEKEDYMFLKTMASLPLAQVSVAMQSRNTRMERVKRD